MSVIAAEKKFKDPNSPHNWRGTIIIKTTVKCQIWAQKKRSEYLSGSMGNGDMKVAKTF